MHTDTCKHSGVGPNALCGVGCALMQGWCAFIISQIIQTVGRGLMLNRMVLSGTQSGLARVNPRPTSCWTLI